jgi:UDP-glucose 4-epimerase
VGDQIDALRAFAGEDAVRLIRRTRDPLIERIVAGWGSNFEAKRARDLGFTAETEMSQILRVHVEDELGGRPS